MLHYYLVFILLMLCHTKNKSCDISRVNTNGWQMHSKYNFYKNLTTTRLLKNKR